MRLINLTGRYIIMGDDRGNVTRIIKPEAETAHIEGRRTVLSDDDGIRVERMDPERIVGLPDPQEGVLYIVENAVARAVDRSDVVTPELTDGDIVQDKYVGIRHFLNVSRLATSPGSQ